MVRAFDEAPVGPNGSRGVALHVIYDETGLPENGAVRISDRGDDEDSTSLRTYAADHHDHRGYGYHYLLVVPEVFDIPDHEVLGEAGDGELLVESVALGGVRGSTFMHELGHSLGLDREDFDGVDSDRYAVEEYPSVMNYATPSDYYGFSDGEGFDDWATIEADFYVPDTSRFNASAG